MDDYWDQICLWMHVWHALFTMGAIVLVLTVISFFITPPGTGAYFINIFNIVFLVPTMIGLLYVMYRCHNQ